MRMTESRLRRIIRQVIAEENIVRLSRGNVDLDKRGKAITDLQASKFMEDYQSLDGFKKLYSGSANGEGVADKLIALLSGKQGNTNEVVIAPGNREDYEWASKNEPNALIPMCIFDNPNYDENVNVIIHRTVDARKYYMIKLNGEPFPKHQFDDPYSSRPVDPDLRHMKRPWGTKKSELKKKNRAREEYDLRRDAAAEKYEEENWWKH